MSERIHCPGCGTLEKLTGIECSCPCHLGDWDVCPSCDTYLTAEGVRADFFYTASDDVLYINVDIRCMCEHLVLRAKKPV
jgi:hypothetical protein